MEDDMYTPLYDQYMMAILSGMAIPIGTPPEHREEIIASADEFARIALEYSSREEQRQWTARISPDGVRRMKVTIPPGGFKGEQS